MRTFHHKIKKTREALGITQLKLAYQANISIAHLQNIESGKANPSLDILNNIVNVLNMHIEINFNPADWDILAHYGVPILPTDHNHSKNYNIDVLLHNLKLACLELKNSESPSLHRNKECIEAFLFAIKSHYKLFYNKYILSSKLLNSLFPSVITGRHIKLKRAVLQKTGNYL